MVPAWIQLNQQCARLLSDLDEIKHGRQDQPDFSFLQEVDFQQVKASSRDLLLQIACHPETFPLYAYKIVQYLDLRNATYQIPDNECSMQFFLKALASKDEDIMSTEEARSIKKEGGAIPIFRARVRPTSSYGVRILAKASMYCLYEQYAAVFPKTLINRASSQMENLLNSKSILKWTVLPKDEQRRMVKHSFASLSMAMLYMKTPFDFSFLNDPSRYQYSVMECMLHQLEEKLSPQELQTWGPLVFKVLSDMAPPQAWFAAQIESCPKLLQANKPKDLAELMTFLDIDANQPLSKDNVQALLSWYTEVPLDMNHLCTQSIFFDYAHEWLSRPGILGCLRANDALCILDQSLKHQSPINILNVIHATDDKELAALKQPWIQMSLWKALQDVSPNKQWDCIPGQLWRAWYGDCTSLESARNPLEWMQSIEPDLTARFVSIDAALALLDLPPESHGGYYAQMLSETPVFDEQLDFNAP